MKTARNLFAIALLSCSFATMAAPVDINAADAASLADNLTGIGSAKARAIVAYRDAHGFFQSADDLVQVKGIGPATVERNRTDIQVSAQ